MPTCLRASVHVACTHVRVQTLVRRRQAARGSERENDTRESAEQVPTLCASTSQLLERLGDGPSEGIPRHRQ